MGLLVNWLSLIIQKWSFGVCLTGVLSTGLAQYSGDPKTEWHLDAHRTRDSLLEAVANLPYKGGNTLTGTSIYFFLLSLVYPFLFFSDSS